MFDLITNNMATILVGIAVFLLIISVAMKMVRDKKSGKSSCSGNCANCRSGKIRPVK